VDSANYIDRAAKPHMLGRHKTTSSSSVNVREAKGREVYRIEVKLRTRE
jgi:hypothetical protein